MFFCLEALAEKCVQVSRRDIAAVLAKRQETAMAVSCELVDERS